MKKKTIIFLLIFISFGQLIYGQKNKIKIIENNLTEVKDFIFEDSIITKYNILDRMDFYKIPSVSIAVINDGKIEWAKTYGYADIETKRLANKKTLYQVASITKSVNGLGIMKLVQEGKLSLTTDIRKYLKSWTFPDNELSKNKLITLKNLLSHTAGLSVHGFIGYSINDSLPTINQILNGEMPANNEAIIPIYPINEHFEYSGGGYTVIRKILDDNISANYDSLMKTVVLSPLKMTNSTFSQPLSKHYKNYAFGTDQEMQTLNGNYYIYPEQSAGGLWSTATDIAKFVISIQNDLKSGPNSILNKKSTQEMLTPILNNYALGFGIVEKGGEKYFWHEGESYGYNSIYYGSFTTGKGVVILTNAYPSNGQPFIQELLNSVATVYNWKDFYKPIKKKLAFVPETLISKYIGEYYSENPQMKISITKNSNQLELTARQTEKMYATKLNTFFLASAPNDECVFSSSKNDDFIDTFEVVQNNMIIITATKKKE
ncbi:serine hydrolase domain-containing protein [Flavobacterium sp. HNIBRBA15423]|uniref:serine hydrolase domain-containing protein n=1 Tax=Flavobacterium sp. HNIBRBA15423 TaxID=3458683 RepID=UPI004043B0D3